MRRPRFLGMLLTCVMLGTDASKFTCSKFPLRRGLTAEMAEDAPTACSSDGISTSNPSAVSERTALAPLRATKTASLPTRHEDEAADLFPASQASNAAKKKRPSVAGRGRSWGRSLRQDEGQDDEIFASETLLIQKTFLTPVLLVFADISCSLSERTIREHLNETTRTWRISRSLLDDVEDDIQVIVNCTKPGDVLTFGPRRRIRPSSRIVIPWPLTLTAPVSSFELEESMFPLSDTKMTFTCPNRGEGVFLVK